ncbi:MAG TPA: hypothetical protein VGO93_27080, partial [Candidatus Xenobia bacterium]
MAGAGRAVRIALIGWFCLVALLGSRPALADPQFDNLMDNARKVNVRLSFPNVWPPNPLVIVLPDLVNPNGPPNQGAVGTIVGNELPPFEVRKGKAESGQLQVVLRFAGYADSTMLLMLSRGSDGVYRGNMSNLQMTANTWWGPLRAELTYHPVFTIGCAVALVG